ncbi:MAG TPA: hypothetical protein VGJ58_06330 [Gaiellaceae bacterium]
MTLRSGVGYTDFHKGFNLEEDMMRRAFVAVVALVVGIALAVPATAATPSTKQLAGQVKTLQKQVKTLQKQVKKTNALLARTEAIAVVALLYGGCNTAATADAFAGSGNPAFAAPPNPVNDYQTCSDLSKVTGTTVARAPNAATVNVFQQLLNIFK